MSVTSLCRSLVLTLAVTGWLAPGAVSAQTQITPFMQGVAEAAADDRDLAEFYRSTGYEPLWIGDDATSRQRRQAFLQAIADAPLHGLPADRYGLDLIGNDLRQARTGDDMARIEVEMSRLFLRYARDVQTGLLTPAKVDSDIVREVPLRDRTATLQAFAKSSPKGFIKQLAPSSPGYARLMKEKMRFEAIVARGGWGPSIPGGSIKPGESGPSVVALRNRLIAMGYLDRTATATYDDRITRAVAQFQTDHGLATDGVAGPATLSALNVSAQTRLSQILVAMERERWTNMPRGKRHVWVNLTDFTAAVVDDGRVTFRTRSVVGKNDPERRSPEFSDVMEHMVINPTWYVPRSITTKEYLPQLQRNPYAVRNLDIVDRAGRVIPREYINFAAYTARTFPFSMREPPNQGNALGLVKFMFPNQYNIYLHDTPAKSLFGREKRDFSHGCIRLADPFDFAYHLLAPQAADPVGFFQARLNTGREATVPLDTQVPVHIVYRTAFTQAKGRVQFRGDVYGRDAKIWRALEAVGVSLTRAGG